MLVEIGGKEYTLLFSWGFLEEVNNRLGLSMETQGGGSIPLQQMGVLRLNSGLESRDVITLVHILQSATVTERQKPSKVDIQNFVEQLLIDGKYVEFYEELEEEIKKQPLLDNLMKQYFGTE